MNTATTPRDVAFRVRAARDEADMPTRVLADHLAMPLNTLYRRLSGETPWRVDELAEVAQLLDVPVSSLIEGTPAITTREDNHDDDA